jgi:hypothetical protein
MESMKEDIKWKIWKHRLQNSESGRSAETGAPENKLAMIVFSGTWTRFSPLW